MAIFMPKGAPKGGTKFAWAVPGFDQEIFDRSEAGQNMAEMEAIYKQYPEDEMNPAVIQYWEDHGIRKELYDADVGDGEGKYSVFTPLDMNKEKKYALVYCSHGGLAPINKCETTGFPMLVGTEKFICVCPWNRGPSNDEVESEFPRILQAMRDNGYPIDEERIYAAGYSAGSDATGVLTCAYPDVLAAVSPDPGGNLFAKGRWYMCREDYEKTIPLRVPLICVGGTMDGGDRYPLQEEHHFQNFNIWMETIAKVKNYTLMTKEKSRKLTVGSDDRSRKAFGFEFHKTYVLQMEGIDWLGGDYLGEEGVAVARFIAGDGLPHAQTKYHAPMIWDFLKHFRKNRETGSSIYTPIVIDGIR